MSLPRGLSLNNPGNIDISKGLPWIGEVTSTDPKFAQFDTVVHGYRAMLKLLSGHGYIGGGINTIDKMISKYCPDSTAAAYIKNVETWSGISRFTVIVSDDFVSLKRIVSAMSRVEQGLKANDADIDAAVAMLQEEKKSPLQSVKESVGLSEVSDGPIWAGVVGFLIFLLLIFKS